MGHIHLGRLPSTKRWRAVVELIEENADAGAVAAASAFAAEKDFTRAVADPTFIEAVRLLALIPQAAKADDFVGALRHLGIDVPTEPSLADLLAGTTRTLDRFAAAQTSRNDFSELSGRVLIATLTAAIAPRLPSLFDPNPNDLKLETAAFARSQDFSRLARHFFGGLVSETLSYWLDRTLSAHVGKGLAFASIAERATFTANLQQYSSEATRIIKEFAGGWYGKSMYEDGTISALRARKFAAVAFKKITEELQAKGGAA